MPGPSIRLITKGRVEMEDTTMIEWGCPDWGGHVHEAENGSWVGDKHDKHKGKLKAKAKEESKSKPEQD
jgi:hypothetical protein